MFPGKDVERITYSDIVEMSSLDYNYQDFVLNY